MLRHERESTPRRRARSCSGFHSAHSAPSSERGVPGTWFLAQFRRSSSKTTMSSNAGWFPLAVATPRHRPTCCWAPSRASRCTAARRPCATATASAV